MKIEVHYELVDTHPDRYMVAAYDKSGRKHRRILERFIEGSETKAQKLAKIVARQLADQHQTHVFVHGVR